MPKHLKKKCCKNGRNFKKRLKANKKRRRGRFDQPALMCSDCEPIYCLCTLSQVFPAEEVVAEAVKLAERIGAQSPLIVQMVKQVFCI